MTTESKIVPIVHKAVNWNRLTDEYTIDFWDINTSQFWLEKEIDLTGDIVTWNKVLSKDEQEAYYKVLVGLTKLDTEQGNAGMPLISLHIKDEQKSAVIAFSGAMEHVHAKSYSAIFSTLCSMSLIDEIFKWGEEQKNLQYKAEKIVKYYDAIFTKDITDEMLYKAMVASVMLESFLFYSGFFYPLYLAGQGKMVASGEIINLIIRDESVHGQYMGLLAQELFEKFDTTKQKELVQWANELLMDLYKNELEYTEEIYSKIGLVEEVNAFLCYNANNAFDNLGFDHLFEDEDINPVVENGLNTTTKNHDFFSVKGNGYTKALNVTPITKETFKIDRLDVDLMSELNELSES
ncbi:putative ribonucelotide-diphosphate reductase beta subunit NrdF [Bacillus phage vB_BspM_Internexus]|nr:putative ribonucelotide-diphosphate reductase beta subunit NrdF [Bacillus phage vB_BspM_Internexus]